MCFRIGRERSIGANMAKQVQTALTILRRKQHGSGRYEGEQSSSQSESKLSLRVRCSVFLIAAFLVRVKVSRSRHERVLNYGADAARVQKAGGTCSNSKKPMARCACGLRVICE